MRQDVKMTQLMPSTACTSYGKRACDNSEALPAGRRLSDAYFCGVPYSGGYTTGLLTSPGGKDGTAAPATGLPCSAGRVGLAPAGSRAPLPFGTGGFASVPGTDVFSSCPTALDEPAESNWTGLEEARLASLSEPSPAGFVTVGCPEEERSSLP